jgi:hypothetical protein
MRRALSLVLLAVLILAFSVPALALPGKPDFSPGVYADGEAWGTKATNFYDRMRGSERAWDKIFVFTNGADGQLPVGEAAPGNPMFSGGRWWVHEATWNADGMAAHDPLPVITSYDDFMIHYDLGHIDVVDAETYFQCPLLPVK